VPLLLADCEIAILDQGRAGNITLIGVGPSQLANRTKDTGNTCLDMALNHGICRPKTSIYFGLRRDSLGD
jgi:hypothetical protein